MALMLGVRLVSWGLAGAVVGITHQYTKDTEEKWYKWVGEKFWRRSPNPAAPAPAPSPSPSPSPSPNSGDSDPIPSTADQLQPQVHNIVEGHLFETRPEERDLAQPNAVNTVQGDLTAGPVNIDVVELTREAPDLVHASPPQPAVQAESAAEPPRSEVVNLRREAPDPTGAPPAAEPSRSEMVNLRREAPDPAGAPPAVQGESAGEPPTSEVVNLCGESPDPPPATGFRAAVKAWIAGKLNWGAPEPDPDPKGRRVPGRGGRMLDPGIRDKIRRILRKLLWLCVDLLVISLFKRNNVWLQIYRIFKCEFSQ